MEDQLIGQINLVKYSSLQLNECTDVANMAILMMYVRFEHEGDLKEEFFFSLLHYQQKQLVLKCSRL